MFKSFKEMPVWIDAMYLAVEIFNLSEQLPKKEDYGLTSQLRRASNSVCGNIAEAFGRYHTQDKINFYYYSRSSVTEIQSHVEYARRVGYITDEKLYNHLNNVLEQIYNELNKIIISLRS